MTFLTFLIFFVSAVWSREPGFVEDLSKHFSKTNNPIVLVVLAIVLVVVVAALVVWEIKKAESLERRKAAVGWQKFYDLAKEKRMKQDQLNLLESILKYSEAASVDSVFTSLLVFENAVENFYEKKMDRLSDEQLEAIRNLRDKIGYLRLPTETPYLSTRNVVDGFAVLLKWDDEGQAQQSVIQKATERHFEVDNPFGGRIKAGASISLSVTRMGDGEYTIFTRVLRVTAQTLVLEHTRNLIRKQLRNWVRIDISQPIELIVEYTQNKELVKGAQLIGKMKDISGGGFSVAVPYQLTRGDMLRCSFSLGKIPLKKISGKIIRVAQKAGRSDQLFDHSLEFVDLETTEREKLIRFVFDKQREENKLR